MLTSTRDHTLPPSIHILRNLGTSLLARDVLEPEMNAAVDAAVRLVLSQLREPRIRPRHIDFDVSPAGGKIVFDRRRENSDLALIELGGR